MEYHGKIPISALKQGGKEMAVSRENVWAVNSRKCYISI